MSQPAVLPSSSSEASLSLCPYAPPRLHVSRPYELSHGARVAAFAKLHGKQLMMWQQDVLNDWGAVNENMQFIHRRCGGSIPRQAGKSDVAVEWALYLAAELKMAVLYTAHNYSTTCEMLRRFREVLGTKASDPLANHPRFNRLIARVENKTAQEAFFFKNGGRIHFSTRTKTATLGFSFDVIFYDEAQELTTEQMQAIAATATSGKKDNPQEIFVGTPKRPGSFGNVFGPMKAEAETKPEDDLCWWQWGVQDVGDIFDESRWFEINPSLGEGIAHISAIRMNCRKFAKLGEEGVLAFAQEFLGYWFPDNKSEPPEIDQEAWNALATTNPPKEVGRVVYAFKFAPDGSTVALAACRKPDEGIPHIEVVEYRSLSQGTAWCADYAEERKATASCFVIDGGGSARALCDELRRRRLPKRAIIEPQAKDVAAACSMFVTGVADVSFTHFAQPALDKCIANIKKRQIGRSGFGFEGIDGADPAMAEACALALWGAHATKRDPRKKGRAGC